ncbi:MAG: 23S rRNA (adenine(2030)-N(6))-methyltransferase RlmJ, partial [Gammaproteobacteria bacterium]
MNYQHAYHAGGTADVFKHIVLIQLLTSLHKKPTAFTYFETHAGNALYDLQETPAQKTLEHQTGIGALWDNKNIKHPAIASYLEIVKSVNLAQTASSGTSNSTETLNFYPGSSLFACHCLRAQDNAIICELHPDVYQNLRAYFKHDNQVHVHQRNGYEALPALLPPKSQRGLVLIDPPYEITDEFQQLQQVLEKVQARWVMGIYAIWFPIKHYEIILDFYNSL